MSNAVYVRTDKNGTKIYHDYTCPRCGGKGGGDQWIFTGWTCYDCGGSGRSHKPQILKEYTPEYQAKLDAQRAKRAEKRRLERVEEFKDNLPKLIEEKGFSTEGKLYAVVGDTYRIKDQLREEGAKWKPSLNSWVFTEDPKEYATVELTAEECLNFFEDEGYVSWKQIDYKELIQSKLPKEDKVVSEYVGSIGERIETEVTLEKVRSWEVPSYSGWGMTTKVLYVFRDTAGNILVWATTGFGVDYNEVQQGDKAILRGTVAEHKEYDGEKQTSLKRCTVKAVAQGMIREGAQSSLRKEGIMEYYETAKSKEAILLTTEIRGYRCEVVKVEDEILLYVDGYFEGELYEEETTEGYISQIEEVLA